MSNRVSRRGVYRQPTKPITGVGLQKTFEYVPSRDGLALLTGGPTDAGYAANHTTNAANIWQARMSGVDGSVSSTKGNGTPQGYDFNMDPEYAWSNGYSPFAIDDGGRLRIRAQATANLTQAFAANEIPNNPITSAAYTYVSGTLTTRNSFSQIGGYFEITAKLPTGAACWPAGWLKALTYNTVYPELDIFEYAGGLDATSTIEATLHVAAGSTECNGIATADLAQSFHRFGVLWTDTAVTFYLDRKAIGSIDVRSNPDILQNAYFVLNNAVGSDINGWVPPPSGATPVISDLLVTSVRAWQFPGPVAIALSALTYIDSLSSGQTVASLSALNYGGNSSYTYSILSDPDGMFAVSGTNLNLAQAVPAITKSSHALTLKVTDGNGASRQQYFKIGLVQANPIQTNYITTSTLANTFWSKTNVTAPYNAQETFGGTATGLNFGRTTQKYAAGAFVPASSYTLTGIGVQFKITAGAPFSGAVSCFIYSADANSPAKPGSLLATATNTIQPTLTTSYQEFFFTFSGIALTSATKYFVVLQQATTDTVNYATWGAAVAASQTLAYYSADGSTWTASVNSQMSIDTFTATPVSNKLLETTANGYHNMFAANIARAAGAKTYQFSLDAAPINGRNYLRIQLYDGGFGSIGYQEARYDLSTGQVVPIWATVTGAWSAGAPFIAPVPGSPGTYRCGLIFTTDALTTNFTVQIAFLSTAPYINTPSGYVGSTTQGMTITNIEFFNVNAGAGGA